MNTQQIHDRIRGQLMEENTPEYDLLTDEMIDDAFNSVSIAFIWGQVGEDPTQSLKNLSSYYTLVKTTGESYSLDNQPMDKIEYTAPEDMLIPLPSVATTQRIIPGADITENQLLQQKAEVVFTEHSDDFSIMDNPFSSSSLKRINASLSQNLITLKVNKRSIVIDISLKYICIPNKISLLLYKEDAQKGLCDLPKGVHNTLVEQAVRYLLEQFQSQRNQRS